MLSRIAMPRRQMIGGGLASLALTGPALAQSQPGFEPLPAQVKVRDRQLTTAVRINGKGPFHFIIDTGADCSVIAEDVAQALHLPVGRNVMVQGIIRSMQAPSVPVAELRFGSLERSNLELPVLPRSLLKADGFLGLDAIGRNRVVFDFKRRTLRVIDSLSAAWVERLGSETLIAAPGDDGHLRTMACRVDGVVTTAFIDTGAEVSAGNEALRRALAERGPGNNSDRDIELTGVTGGSRMGKVVKVDSILFGNLEFSGCEIAAADLDVFRIWNLADEPALLIGLNFLREFQTVTIDYGRKEFRLKLASAAAWVSRKHG
ncbi:retroviral-like aspartic protease family protein [Rhizomicrobium electricum]|uniref:Retropepsin-like aspartic protease n=1 Tax=Rhizomicrobium electricum TaxID=480070 RepID=A0ABP3PZ33_9PROT|nr:retroviral-like aspartic protease family protein [Rhizomicrobium electricum]NIJ50145.1 putative aspartyl protease [Rhizomicrobium electricum]